MNYKFLCFSQELNLKRTSSFSPYRLLTHTAISRVLSCFSNWNWSQVEIASPNLTSAIVLRKDRVTHSPLRLLFVYEGAVPSQSQSTSPRCSRRVVVAVQSSPSHVHGSIYQLPFCPVGALNEIRLLATLWTLDAHYITPVPRAQWEGTIILFIEPHSLPTGTQKYQQLFKSKNGPRVFLTYRRIILVRTLPRQHFTGNSGKIEGLLILSLT